MPREIKVGCSAPSVKTEVSKEIESINNLTEKKEETRMLKVGSKAPEFTAKAFFNGEFVEVKLSDYLGKWVLLCFYPGDFTFV